MERMKSAFERAMERVDGLEAPSEDQLLEWKLVPEGRKLAADFLKGEGSPFTYLDSTHESRRHYLILGMAQTMVSNIQLPSNDSQHETNARMLDGLDRLFKDKMSAKEIVGQFRYVLEQYEKFGIPQKQQSYEQLRLQFRQQVEEAIRGGQLSNSGLEHQQVNVESLPEFQQHWVRISNQLDQQYQQHLEQYRDQLLGLM